MSKVSDKISLRRLLGDVHDKLPDDLRFRIRGSLNATHMGEGVSVAKFICNKMCLTDRLYYSPTLRTDEEYIRHILENGRPPFTLDELARVLHSVGLNYEGDALQQFLKKELYNPEPKKAPETGSTPKPSSTSSLTPTSASGQEQEAFELERVKFRFETEEKLKEIQSQRTDVETLWRQVEDAERNVDLHRQAQEAEMETFKRFMREQREQLERDFKLQKDQIASERAELQKLRDALRAPSIPTLAPVSLATESKKLTLGDCKLLVYSLSIPASSDPDYGLILALRNSLSATCSEGRVMESIHMELAHQPQRDHKLRIPTSFIAAPYMPYGCIDVDRFFQTLSGMGYYVKIYEYIMMLHARSLPPGITLDELLGALARWEKLGKCRSR
jgi:hypothetical protein